MNITEIPLSTSLIHLTANGFPQEMCTRGGRRGVKVKVVVSERDVRRKGGKRGSPLRATVS